MVAQSFVAFNSNNFVVTSSSSSGLVGNGIINNSDTPDGTVFLYSAGSGTEIIVDDTNSGANADIFGDDDTANHSIIDGGGIVANGTPVEAESRIFVQALDINGAPTGPTITVTVFSQNGQFGDVWGFSTDIPLVDGVSYIKTSGSNTGSSSYDSFVTCFGSGTLIRTKNGAKAIETLSVGEQVWTKDNGHQTVRWIGRTRVDALGAFAPVVFAPGSIGNDRELIVSQEHRMHLKSAMSELLFGIDNCLVAAKHLCRLPGVSLREGGMVEYFHLMFGRHEIISGNDVLSESFFLSETSVSAIEQVQRAELLSLFPDLATGMQTQGATATLTLKAHEAALLMACAANQNISLTTTAA
ncbi:hypothetical protein ROA7450_02350 [Roseovarius albus]|uniref:Hedgehog/Intein (Hint) domain-containing protein n=1 Tax=Roseovarius albus TaxID=1247867 RepID=A0A1X6ZCC5_9RHOB|nr:Hint domain-containing protein [Roseovarius albus]SLN47498.1 hypothetical protein ROA7450_02350 [Roseovarius albus]